MLVKSLTVEDHIYTWIGAYKRCVKRTIDIAATIKNAHVGKTDFFELESGVPE